MLQREFNFRSLMVKEDGGTYRLASGDEIIRAAIHEINARFARGALIASPAVTQDYLKLKLAHLEHEMFAVLWLDNRHRVIVFEELFRGTIDGASIYPREIVKSSLRHNAAACILAHNHPSGVAEPSQADRQITQKIKEALTVVDVRTLDHVIVAERTYSFADHGLM